MSEDIKTPACPECGKPTERNDDENYTVYTCYPCEKAWKPTEILSDK